MIGEPSGDQRYKMEALSDQKQSVCQSVPRWRAITWKLLPLHPWNHLSPPFAQWRPLMHLPYRLQRNNFPFQSAKSLVWKIQLRLSNISLTLVSWNKFINTLNALLYSRRLKRPFYSCALNCQAFNMEWGWRWPCWDRDQHLVSRIPKQFTYEKQQGLYHNKVTQTLTPVKMLGNQARDCKMDFY